MFRLQKYEYLAQSLLISKSHSLKKSVTLNSLEIHAGQFKPASTFVEHGLLVTNLTGQSPIIKLFKHGKRLRSTILIKTKISTKWKWAVLDKFLNTFIPTIGDLTAYSTKRSKISTYSWRIRNFFEWADADPLLSDRIMKKDIFLPLFIDINISNDRSQKQNEDFLRMLRVPVNLFKSYN